MLNQNNLQKETSPYLLQHALNPVYWQPWSDETFKAAREEDKPILLSIGYSTCHWCHVMAHESFEDPQVAKILNENFISIKVDKEERPDIDSIYMNVCQAFTGRGGWPLTIFMTPEQKPFFAGTYFPKTSQHGLVGLVDLLSNIKDKWQNNREILLKSGDQIIEFLSKTADKTAEPSKRLIDEAVSAFKSSFDQKNGGFGTAPKFPAPHNLMFLLNYYELENDSHVLNMVEKTLQQMYKGGICDHIGGGFCRYSTDNFFLVPHFEKMLYDNALMIICYIKAFQITKIPLYRKVAIKTSDYILREMTDQKGGFYSAQDADSDGVEGKFYVFDYDEIIKLFGQEAGEKINKFYGMTPEGNFEGKNIPNLLNNGGIDESFAFYLPKLYEYRRSRTKLHLDDKILTSWNSLMIAAFASMYRVMNSTNYLTVAQTAEKFIAKNLASNSSLYVSFREGKKSGRGFFDDYAYYIYALINLYEACFDNSYLEKATKLTETAIKEFYDTEKGGFYLYGSQNEQLIIKNKETYDTALPSGNSVMTYNLIKLSRLNNDKNLAKIGRRQLEFMAGQARNYPVGYCFYLSALAMSLYPSREIICVLKQKSDIERLKSFKLNTTIKILEGANKEYPLINDKTTFYVCENYQCLPPTNDWEEISK